MSKIKYVLLIFVLAFHVVSAENLSTDKKKIKDILLEISEKIEGLEKTFLLPDNGFIEDGEASSALIELDLLRIKLKKIEGELEKIENILSSQISSINKNLEKISVTIQKFDKSFVLEDTKLKFNINQNQVTYVDTDTNQLNDFESLKLAKKNLTNSEYDNAKIIFEFFKSIEINLFSQKTGWNLVQNIQNMPYSYKDGSLFITNKSYVPW